MPRELLFSVTASDCNFDYYRGSGKGGQKRNKTSSAVRCKHKVSGAMGQSDDTRSQHQNKVIAFRRMAETPVFTAWHKLETARVTGRLDEVEVTVARAMTRRNLRVEGRDAQGRWTDLEALV